MTGRDVFLNSIGKDAAGPGMAGDPWSMASRLRPVLRAAPFDGDELERGDAVAVGRGIETYRHADEPGAHEHVPPHPDDWLLVECVCTEQRRRRGVGWTYYRWVPARLVRNGTHPVCGGHLNVKKHRTNASFVVLERARQADDGRRH